jgi:hypothetical protein
MAVDIFEGNHSQKSPPDRKPQFSLCPHIDVDASEAPNPGIKITGSDNTKYEELDERHKKRRDARNFFIKGRVFAVLWHERSSIASQAGSLAAAAGSAAEMTRFGERAYTHMRRMVVVQEIPRYCTCIPIWIYTNTNTDSKNISITSDGKVLQVPQTPELIRYPMVSRRVADERLHNHD